LLYREEDLSLGFRNREAIVFTNAGSDVWEIASLSLANSLLFR